MMGLVKIPVGELEVVKVGGEFIVNQLTAGDQNDSSVAGLTNGNFAVSYTDVTTNGDNVIVRLFDPAGTSIAADYVEPQLTTNQTQSNVTSLAEGTYIVVFADVGGLTGDTRQGGVNAQLFNADGTASGSSFLVNTTLTGDQSLPKITSLEGGGFVATWSDALSAADGTKYGTRAQVFDVDGVNVGDEIAVNSVPGVNRDGPDAPTIVSLTGGGFVIVRVDGTGATGDTSDTGVVGQIYTANGTAVGSPFLVNTQTDGVQLQPVITGLAGGGFVVAWTDTSGLGDGNNFSIQAQVYGTNGLKVGSEFLVNTTTAGVQFQPAISSLEDGGFVIAWSDYSQTGGDISLGSVRAQAFDSEGDKVGSEVLVNTQTSGFQRDAAITGLANGNFAVTWNDEGTLGDGDGTSVKGQIFALNHKPVISSDGGSNTAAIAIDENTAAVTTVTANDADAGTTFFYSVGGDDASKFIINSGTGALAFKAGPNFEAPGDLGADNVYNVLVTVSDGSSTDNQAIAVTVRDVAPEPPVITSNGGGDDASVSLPENSLLVTTVEARDDDGNTTFAYAISGGIDEAKFKIDADTGELSFVAAPDFEAPDDGGPDNIYDVRVTVSDGSLTDEQFIAVTVTNVVNEVIFGTNTGETLTGSDGDDQLFAGAGDDTLIGKGGNDQLFGGTGADMMTGGTGNDVYYIGSKGDKVIELADGGFDTVYSSNSYRLGDNVENLRARGTASLVLTGNGLDNRIAGGTGDDAISGEDGADRLSGGDGIDVLDGGAGADTLSGGDDFDVLDGGLDADTLSGGMGDDALTGGGGRDVLTGGQGADLFLFETPGNGALDRDTVTDFSSKQGDNIMLLSQGFAGLRDGKTLDADAFYAASGARGGQDAEDRIIFDTRSGNLYYDADGVDGVAAVLFARVLGNFGPFGLNAEDFLIF